RLALPPELQAEITPKNILMIGPTGVGKTEIARRLARLADAPFIKVEATKFTQVGYVGRDADSLIRHPMDVSVGLVHEERIVEVRERAAKVAEERIVEILTEKEVAAQVPSIAAPSRTTARSRGKSALPLTQVAPSSGVTAASSTTPATARRRQQARKSV